MIDVVLVSIEYVRNTPGSGLDQTVNVKARAVDTGELLFSSAGGDLGNTFVDILTVATDNAGWNVV